ncbi:MAG: hypothetical protein ABSE07_02120 [Methanoregula sp.]|jgi:hypothetical protein
MWIIDTSKKVIETYKLLKSKSRDRCPLLENVTRTLSNIDYSFNVWTFFLSQLMSVILILLTVFLTVMYTEYRKDKRNFESVMGGYIIELGIIRTEIDTLKSNSEIILKGLNETPKPLPLLIFPRFSLESHNAYLSSGSGKYIPYEDIIKMSRIYVQLDNLLLLQARYESLYPIFFKEGMVGENYYNGLKDVLKQLITQIDVFHKECETFEVPKFPSFVTLILRR